MMLDENGQQVYATNQLLTVDVVYKELQERKMLWMGEGSHERNVKDLFRVPATHERDVKDLLRLPATFSEALHYTCKHSILLHELHSYLRQWNCTEPSAKAHHVLQRIE